MAHPPSIRVIAARPLRRAAATALAVAAVAGCAVTQVPGGPETVALLAREPNVVAVHDHEISVHRSPDTRIPQYAWVGAPAGRIKDGFLRGLRPRVGAVEIRNVVPPRFAYRVRGGLPDPASLKRTFGRALAFDFYSTWEYLRPDVKASPRLLAIQARLIRLEDLTVLWAERCTFEPGWLLIPQEGGRVTDAAPLFTADALRRADACADTLVASFLGTAR